MTGRGMERGSLLQGAVSHKSIGLNVFGTESITAMDISKDTDFIAVAGRKMLKIITVQKDGFAELANLCGKKGKMNLDYSITDIQWDPIQEQRLATAAGNGTILVWQVNLSKTSRHVNMGKTDYTVHKRTVNKISFHPTDRDILISGSQDGTMRCFDLRKQDPICTFQGKSQNASIRDVQFEPFEGKCFAAATETGNIQLWDMRKPDNCYEQFVAHIGPVFSLDWHPEERAWLGSAGRDKLVKVWDTQQKPVDVHQIQAIAEVARIRWRPGKKYHIASCALLKVDINVSVWDIRRPYIPHAQFTQHKDAVTGIAWHKDPNMLFSCGKDSMIYRNCYHDAYRPVDHAPPVALGISSTGNIAFAKSGQLKAPEPKPKQKTNIHLTASLGVMRIQQISKMEEITPVTSTLINFSLNKQDDFQYLAKNYRLSGLTFSELCDHNSELCTELDLHHHAQTWNMMKVLYSCSFSKLAASSPGSTKVVSSNCTAPISGTTAVDTVTGNGRPGETPLNQDDNELQGIVNSKDTTAEENADDSSVNGDELTENETYLTDKDFVFDFQFDSQNICSDMQNEDYTLANEAFEPRQDIEDRPPSPEQDQDRPETPISAIDSDITSAYNQQVSFVDPAVNNEEHTTGEIFPKWDYSDVVVDCLKYYANLGDIQMCVSVLLVLGDKIKDKVDERTQEQWMLSYVDLLSRLQMWTIATEVMNISNMPALTELNQTSTTIHTICSNEACKKPLPPEHCGWSCGKCKSLTPPCIICHTTVRGLLAWCQGCGHGGHLPHIQKWFKNYRLCPTGCGHHCEY